MFDLEKEKQCNAEYAERVKERLITATQYVREDELKIDIVENLLGKVIDDIMNAIDEAEYEGLDSIPHLYTCLYFAMLAYSNYDLMQGGNHEQAALEWSIKGESGRCVWANNYDRICGWLVKLQKKYPKEQFHIDCNATDLMLELKNLHSKVEYDNAKMVRNHD